MSLLAQFINVISHFINTVFGVVKVKIDMKLGIVTSSPKILSHKLLNL